MSIKKEEGPGVAPAARTVKSNTKGLQTALILLAAGIMMGGLVVALWPSKKTQIVDVPVQQEEIIPLLETPVIETVHQESYIAHLEFSIDAANTDRTYLDPRSTKMQIIIPISKDYYEATRDSMVLKSNTIVSNKFANLLNISTITLLKREKIEL